ncbi:hypothetical protein LTR53_015298 [Teratosphaeriaceae sp. CCFEE 6253]|nr:hypothetical protein LTR53_015298 [Teratosphaeriaceae sp. CCFEE 6253]
MFGATGVAGVHIVKALVANKSSFTRLGLFTSQNTVEKKADAIERLRKEGFEIHVGDVGSGKDVAKAYESYDTVVNAAGRNAILSQIDLLRWAEQTPNIKRFFPSEYGTDIEYYPASVDEKPHQLKLKVRAYIKEHVKRVEHTYVVTGPYAEMALSSGMPGWPGAGRYDVKAREATLIGSGDYPVSYTSMPDLGTLVVKALLHPEDTRNRALRVNSFTATHNEVLAEFEKQLGEKFSVSYTSLDELKRLEREAWEKGDPLATPITLRRIWSGGGTLYERRDNGLIDGEDTETLATVVERIIRSQS